MKTSGWLIASILAVAALVAISLALQWLLSPVVGRVNERTQVTSASSRIESYNHFFDLCSEVQSYENQIANEKAQLSQTSAATDRSRLQTDITALENQRASDINQYNADAQKQQTMGQFRSHKLPLHLSLSASHTVCHVSSY